MFKTRLKALRKSKKISQLQLAEKLNVKQSTVACWETGIRTPTFKMLQTLADYFDVTVDYLLGREEEEMGTDDFSYALYNESKDLSEEDVKTLLDMAKFLRAKNGKN